MILLPQKMVHVWLLDQHTLNKEEHYDKYREWLDSEETARMEKLTEPQRQKSELQTRAMVRWCLAQYSDSIRPDQLEIKRDEKGKPFLADKRLPLSFNLSHCGRWLALALTTKTAIGIDIEDKSRSANWQAIAQRYFHHQEVAQLERLPESQRRERFFTLWTLKEAYFKARGSGISTGLEKVKFDIDNNGAITPEFAASLKENAQAWQFHHYHLGENYCLSLALQQPHAQDAETHFYKTIPGRENIPLELEAHRIILH